MSDLSTQLNKLWQIPESEREKGIKLLTKIYSNILNNPTNRKFQDLNLNKIRRKLDKCIPAFHLLLAAGFTPSDDGSRLQWENNDITMKKLKDVHNALQTKRNGDEFHLDTQQQSIHRDNKEEDNTDDDEELRKAIAMSMVEKRESNVTASNDAYLKMLGIDRNDEEFKQLFGSNKNMYKVESLSWKCGTCTYLNDPTQSVHEFSLFRIDNRFSTSRCQMCGNMRQTTRDDKWQCSFCSFKNQTDSSICSMCKNTRNRVGDNDKNEDIRVQRVKYVSNIHRKWIEKKIAKQDIIDIYDLIHDSLSPNYNFNRFLNDYKYVNENEHLLGFSNEIKDENDENLCDASPCFAELFDDQHRREREKVYRVAVNETSTVFFNVKDTRSIEAQQLLHSAHCFVCHGIRIIITMTTQFEATEDDIDKQLRILLETPIHTAEEDENRRFAIAELYQIANLIFENPKNQQYHRIDAKYMDDAKYSFAVGPNEWVNINGLEIKTTFRRYGRHMLMKRWYTDDPDTQCLDQYVCVGSVKECRYFKYLKSSLSIYESRDVIENGEAFATIIDSFSHLIMKHDNDVDFEYIYRELGALCDMKQCNRFSRNRNRRYTIYDDPKATNFEEVDYVVNEHIIDKIHCYYRHSYDMGYRLTSVDKSILHEVLDDDEKYSDVHSVHSNVTALRNLLTKKRQLVDASFEVNVEKDSVPKSTVQKDSASQPKPHNTWHCHPYIGGHSFCYDTVDHYRTDKTYSGTSNANVKPKYSNIKQEMIQNELVRITIQRFNAEFAKAEKYKRSQYGRQYQAQDIAEQQPVAPSKLFVVSYCNDGTTPIETFTPENKVTPMEFECHILALVLYCNCTALQCKFSETFRNGIRNHSSFYWFGKYLAQAVGGHGTHCVDCKTKRFYHGVDAKLLCPEVTNGMSIYGPVSTSSRFEVAVQFAGYTGMVFEFKDAGGIEAVDNISYVGGGTSCSEDKPPTYVFRCDWLSDYASEKEFLFVNDSTPLQIVNITDVTTNEEYIMILTALRLIENNVGEKRDINRGNLWALMCAIINDIITSKRMEDLSYYGRALVNKWRETVKRRSIIVDWMYWEKENCNWMRMEFLAMIFPKLFGIEIANLDVANAKVLIDLIHDYLKVAPKSILKIEMKASQQYCVDVYAWANTNRKQITSRFSKLKFKVKISDFGTLMFERK